MNSSVFTKTVEMSARPIECITKTTYEDVYDASFGHTRPTLIKNAISQWKAVSSWNTQYFKSKFGSLTVQVACSRDGVFRGDPQTGFEKRMEQMEFGKFLDLVSENGHSEKKYYLQQQPLDGQLSSLQEDIEIPDYIDQDLLKEKNLWFGPGGNVSPLHFDSANNLLAQVAGSKLVILFSPEQSDCLYPYPKDSKTPHMAQVDIERPNLTKFPKFQNAQWWKAQLEAGDILFMPILWWHQVYSLSMAISVNFWYSIF